MTRLRFVSVALLLALGLSFQGLTAAAAASDVTALPLEECTKSQHSLSVLFLVDTSASLGATDPNNQRVTGLKLAISALAGQRTAKIAAGTPFQIFVDVLSFGTAARRSLESQRSPWAELAEDNAPLLAEMDNFRSDKRDADTDYVSALDPTPSQPAQADSDPASGALRMLSTAPTGSCRLLVWFTDGKFDIDPPASGRAKKLTWTDRLVRNEDDAKRVVELGRKELCKDGGLADRLRTGDIKSGEGAQVAVVALGNDPKRYELIKGIADGSGATQCGREAPRGTMYLAEDVNDLLFSLQGAVVGPGDGKVGDHIPSCQPGQDCASVDPAKVEPFDYPFLLTPGIASFNIVAIASEGSVSTILIDPAGHQQSLDGLVGTTTMDNGTVLEITSFASIASVHQLRAILSDDPNAWSGLWRVRFVATKVGHQNDTNQAALYVYAGDPTVRLQKDVVLRKGRTGKIVLEFSNRNGRLITRPVAMPTPQLDVKIEGKSLSAGDLRPDGTWRIDYPVDNRFSGESLELVADLTIKAHIDPSLPEIIIFGPKEIKVGSLTVRAIPHYPLLDDPIAIFKNALSQKHTTTSSTLTLSAPGVESAGCVSLAAIVPPSDADMTTTVRVFDRGIEVLPNQGCVHLSDGDQRDLTIEVSAQRSDIVRNAGLKGSLKFTSVNDVDPTQHADFNKEFFVPVTPIFSSDINWLTVFLMTLGALALSLFVLYGLNFYGARLDVGAAAFATIPVTYLPGKIQRVHDKTDLGPFHIRDEDLNVVLMPPPGKYRQVSVGGVDFSGRTTRSPFSDVFGSARSTGKTFVVSNRGSSRVGNAGRLDASLSGAWVFAAISPPTQNGDSYDPVDGVVTMIVPPRPDEARSLVRERIAEMNDIIGDSCLAHRTEIRTEPSVEHSADPRDHTPGIVPDPPPDPFTQTLAVTPPQSDPVEAAQTRRFRKRVRSADSSHSAGAETTPPPQPF